MRHRSAPLRRRILCLLASLIVALGLSVAAAPVSFASPTPIGDCQDGAGCTGDPSPQTTSDGREVASSSTRYQAIHNGDDHRLDSFTYIYTWPDGSNAKIIETLYAVNVYLSALGGEYSENTSRLNTSVSCYLPSGAPHTCHEILFDQFATMGNKGNHDFYWQCGSGLGRNCSSTANAHQVTSPEWDLSSIAGNPAATTGCKDPVKGYYSGVYIVNGSYWTGWSPPSVSTKSFRMCDTTDG